MGFVMVLRPISTPGRQLLRGRGAFEAWRGVPRELWYDLRSVVAAHPARSGSTPGLDFAGHYRFLPRPVAVAGATRRAGWSARYAMCAAACALAVARPRRPQRPGRGLVRRPRFRPPVARRPVDHGARGLRARARLADRLPGDAWPSTSGSRCGGKTPYGEVRQERQRAAHPCAPHGGGCDPRRGAILDGARSSPATRAASTSWRASRTPAHRALARRKRNARRLRARTGCSRPRGQRALLADAATPATLGTIVAALLRLLDEYGAAELETAIARGVPHPNAPDHAQARAARPAAAAARRPAAARHRGPRPRPDRYDGLAGKPEEDSET